MGDPAQQAASATPLLPFDDAVVAVTDALLASARLPDVEPSGRHLLVIDPLIDGVIGALGSHGLDGVAHCHNTLQVKEILAFAW